MKAWLMGVTAASVISMVALALCPPGRVRGVTRLACGIVCAMALAAPFLRLDVTELSRAMAGYEQAARKITENEEEDRKLMERTYIEDRCEAYISDKAAVLGVYPVSVSVLARWDGDVLAWYPYEASLGCGKHQALSRIIESDLGIPAERQSWSPG